MNQKENIMKAWTRTKPEWIPISSGLPYLDWKSFGYDADELERVCIRHDILFPGYEHGFLARNHEYVQTGFPDLTAGKPYVDYWGCKWETSITGMVGAVTVHPLENWDSFKGFCAPDPDDNDGLRKISWQAIEDASRSPNRNDIFLSAGLPHGHTFLRVQDLRGYMNFIYDMADEEPLIDELLDMVCDFNLKIINRFLTYKPDCISIPEDLGMQNTPMLSVEQFRKYIAPRYEKMTKPIKAAGVIVHEHSDGYIMDLMDDIIKTGGTVINMQDLVNGIDNIEKHVKGRISIDLDIDRQNITVFGTPKDIDDHIKECVSKLGTHEGGLSLTYQPWPPISATNLDAVFTAMEKYCVKEYMHK
ncbi:MAG: uroporphyrinogen decarboxylase family protein [Saccharofermentanales bacterium]